MSIHVGLGVTPMTEYECDSNFYSAQGSSQSLSARTSFTVNSEHWSARFNILVQSIGFVRYNILIRLIWLSALSLGSTW